MTQSVAESRRPTIASALDWHEAHVDFDAATARLPVELRGRRPEGFPHSPWELVEHIRRAQADLLDFVQNAAYVAPKWPDDYWPGTPTPPTPGAWDESLASVRHDRERLQSLVRNPALDLTATIPHGTGQTYLRTILLALDHTSYHVGQLIAVRRLLGAWPVS